MNITIENFREVKISELLKKIVADIDVVIERGYRFNMNMWVGIDEYNNNDVCVCCLGGAALMGLYNKFPTVEEMNKHGEDWCDNLFPSDQCKGFSVDDLLGLFNAIRLGDGVYLMRYLRRIYSYSDSILIQINEALIGCMNPQNYSYFDGILIGEQVNRLKKDLLQFISNLETIGC